MAVAGGLALSATVLVAAAPGLRFAYVSPTTRIAMETSQAVIAGVVAVLVHGRFRRSGSRLDLLLTIALGVSGVGNLSTVAVRAAGEDRATLSELSSWSALGLSLAAAIAYAAAGHLPDRTVAPVARSVRAPLGGIVATSLVVWLLVLGIVDHLPPAVTGDFVERGASRPALDGSAGAYVLHAAVLGALIAAAAGFARRAGMRPQDDLLRAVGLGLVLAAVARVNFILYPSIHTTVVHTGDVARLAFYLLLLGGAVREISSYWSDRTQLAVLEERRRIARELHDGVVQELTFIRSQVSSFPSQAPSPAVIGFVTEAADHALAESRRAVEALSDDATDALDVVIRRAVAEVAERAGLAVRFVLPAGSHADPETTEQVRRIAREAAVNAVRHAGASVLTVSLRERGDRISLAITDDGRGFDPDAPVSGFGLRGMGERAESVGGTLTVSPDPGGGTTVRIEVPGSRPRQLDTEVLGDEPGHTDGVS